MALRRKCPVGKPRALSAWGWIDGRLYEARHINGPAGTYKGYEIEKAEYPEDPENRLDWGKA